MDLQTGEHVYYRIMPSMTTYTGTIVSCDDKTIVLQPHDNAREDVPAGQYLLISEMDTETDYYTVILGKEAGALNLKRMWTGKRGYFRVDDAFPLLYRKVEGDARSKRARVLSGSGFETPSVELPDKTVSPRLWQMFADINTKLEIILERLNLEHEGIARADNVPVNISASGIRFTVDGKFSIGDELELKMLLPVYPPVGMIVYGNVIRTEELDNGACELAIQFSDLDDEIQDIIIQYTLKRQRENIRRLKQWEQGGT